MDPDELPTKAATPAPHRPNAISSILNHPRTEESNIDPSLSVPLRPSAGSSPNSTATQEDKQARRERLIREQEAAKRNAEAAKREEERIAAELAELGHD